MIHALLDTNVVIDAFLKRQPWGPDANALLQADFERKFVAYITATSLTDMFYVTRRQAGFEEAWQLVDAERTPICPSQSFWRVTLRKILSNAINTGYSRYSRRFYCFAVFQTQTFFRSLGWH